jgi:hypothetical protein
MPRLKRQLRRTVGASRSEMGLLKSGALVAVGATGMHFFGKSKQSSQSAPPPPPQSQYYYQQSPPQESQYYETPAQQRQYYETPIQQGHQGQYYQRPPQQGQQQRAPYQNQSSQRAIESGSYVHQSYCNGTCGERCNSVLDLPPMYASADNSKGEAKARII